jgi:hypothetical protein
MEGTGDCLNQDGQDGKIFRIGEGQQMKQREQKGEVFEPGFTGSKD